MVDQSFIENLFENSVYSKGSVDYLGAGYAPAHITGIFEIHNTHPEPLKCGSRGIGLCIDKGVSTFVLIKKGGKQEIKVLFNNEEISGRTTKTTIKNLVGDLQAQIDVFSFSELPQSQGFGLSGAGALSSAIALNSALNLDLGYDELVNAAHKAEIANQTGLGDIIAQATGGVVLRTREGGFNFGSVKKLNIEVHDTRIVICVIGKELDTSNIITDKLYIKKINSKAKRYLEEFQTPSTYENFSLKKMVNLSFKFSSEIGLMNSQVANVINRIHEKHTNYASMIMLGNSIFAIGDINKLNSICQGFGYTAICKINKAPACSIKLKTNF